MHHITGYHGRRSDAIYAFIASTLSWLHVADLPEPMLLASSLVLPSGDLVMVKNEVSQHSKSIFKASLKGKCHTLSVIFGESVPKSSKLYNSRFKFGYTSQKVQLILIIHEIFGGEFDLVDDLSLHQINNLCVCVCFSRLPNYNPPNRLLAESA